MESTAAASHSLKPRSTVDGISPSAARSLEDGLEETLTLHWLGLNVQLRRSLSSTNLIESCFARTASWARRIKRWRDARMVMRWGAAALLVAEKGFRRIQGYQHPSELLVALEQHQKNLQTSVDRLMKAA